MSDATLKIFAYLLLMEEPEPPFICIEEPENGLYIEDPAGVLLVVGGERADRPRNAGVVSPGGSGTRRPRTLARQRHALPAHPA
jgi:hypothetical protein